MYSEQRLLRKVCKASDEVFSTDQCQNFYHILSEPSQWRNTMFQMGGNGHAPKAIRCDKSSELMTEHDVNGVVYESWATVIKAKAKKRIPVFSVLNGTMGTGHSSRDLRELKYLYIDIDCHNEEFIENVPYMAADAILRRLEHDMLPLPFVCHSGRGLHLIWPINFLEVKRGSGNLKRWRIIEAELVAYMNSIVETFDFMSGWNVDSCASDATRLLRLPGSYNPQSETFDTVLWGDVYRSDLGIFEDFFDCQSDTSNAVDNGKENGTYIPGVVNKLMTFAKGRKWNLTGHRNAFLTVLTSSLLWEDRKNAENRLHHINGLFSEPLTNSEVKAILRSCKSKMYKWSYAKIIDFLQMSMEEARLFKKLTRSQAYAVAQKTGADFRKPNRRRDAERAKRKEEKYSMYQRFAAMRAEGKTAAEIAKYFAVSIYTVYKHWNSALTQVAETETKLCRSAIRAAKQKAKRIVGVIQQAAYCATAFLEHSICPFCFVYSSAQSYKEIVPVNVESQPEFRRRRVCLA